ALSGAVGALSGPLHGGAPSRVLTMLDDVEREGDADRYVKAALDRGERLMGFGHRVYRAEDPRARVLRRTARELGAPRFEVAEALERAALAELQARRPDRVLATNVEFWAAIVLDFAPRCPRTCSPPCSPAPARPAGPRTSSSRSAPAGSSGPARATSARDRDRCPACPGRARCSTARSEPPAPTRRSPGPSSLDVPSMWLAMRPLWSCGCGA